MTVEERVEKHLANTVCQGCRNICEGDCAYAKPVRRAYESGYNECSAYAKTIIQDLLENTDEYARQRAEDFLKGE